MSFSSVTIALETIQSKKGEAMQPFLRPMKEEEYPLLSDFLYEAIFVPAGVAAPPRSVLSCPELQVYIAHFGTGLDDHCFVAEQDGALLGAVWVRNMQDYGFVDCTMPSLAIALYPAYRTQGLGTALLKKMLAFLQSKGYPGVSLSVQKENPASRLYLSLGFVVVKETEEEWVMVHTFSALPKK